MTPTIAAESLIFGCVLLSLVLSEAMRWLRLRRLESQTATAKASLRYWNEVVDKEMK